VKNHLGFPEERIILIENGDVLEIDGERAMVVDKRDVKRTFIDESGFEEIDNETVRERKKMAYDGMITLVMTINGQTGELQAPPKIISHGVRGFETNGFAKTASASKNLTKDAERIVAAALAGASRQTLEDETLLKEHVRLELKRFIQKETGARPVIVPVIQQV